MNVSQLVEKIKASAPSLWPEIHELSNTWLAEPITRSDDGLAPHRIMHVNDPVWGTIELMPWESILLDSELVQRLRGVKQLGLAHLVFPRATHDRFSHVCGVVAAAERMVESIRRNANHRRQAKNAPIAKHTAPSSDYLIDDGDRYITRLAALVHDVGHGPFSHAVEPLLEIRYGTEFACIRDALTETFKGVGHIQPSELISVLVVLSKAFQKLLSSLAPRFGSSRDYVTNRIVASIIGGLDGSPGECLASLVSSQIDADKLDYMARDAHHAGLPIDFDSERLITKLEVAVISRITAAPRLRDLAERADTYPQKQYNDIAIASAGVGAFEQMLVGRTFLYDRLYHHHKVRTADAMAQRLVHYADENKSLKLTGLFQSLPDEAMIRALGGLIDAGLNLPVNQKAKDLALALVSRKLYKRAFAFAGRFLAGLEFDAYKSSETAEFKDGNETADVLNLSEQEKDAECTRVLTQVNKKLSDLPSRLKVEAEIAALAREIGGKLPTRDPLHNLSAVIQDYHVIVDLPRSPIPARIQVIAMMEDGRIEIPDVFYDPARWSAVYDLQRRTGYVFCEPKYVELVATASRIWFLRSFQAVLSPLADRYSKTVGVIKDDVYQHLQTAGSITQSERALLEQPRLYRSPLREDELRIPESWQAIKPEFRQNFAKDFNNILEEGLPALTIAELRRALLGVFRFMQTMSEDAEFATKKLSNEAELQRLLVRALRNQHLDITEGAEVSGGETDVVIGKRFLIENKVESAPTDNPFRVGLKHALQGRRYTIATSERFFVTLLAYTPASEGGILRPADAVQVRQVEGVSDRCIEIRCVIPVGMSVPSKAKLPPKLPVSKKAGKASAGLQT